MKQIIRYGGSRNESSLRKPFQDLLEQYAWAKNLVLVAEFEMESKKGTHIRPDGVLKDALRGECDVSMKTQSLSPPSEGGGGQHGDDEDRQGNVMTRYFYVF